jgi:hypothetical protein
MLANFLFLKKRIRFQNEELRAPWKGASLKRVRNPPGHYRFQPAAIEET